MPRQPTRDVVVMEVMRSLRRIIKSIKDYSYEVSRKFGVTGPELWVLKTISTNGSVSPGHLSKKMYLHPSTITGVVDRLEKKFYVLRDRGQEDRRAVRVHLTAKGKKLVRKAPNPIQGKMIFGLRKLKREELNSIYDALKKLVGIVEAQNVKVTFIFDQE